MMTLDQMSRMAGTANQMKLVMNAVFKPESDSKYASIDTTSEKAATTTSLNLTTTSQTKETTSQTKETIGQTKETFGQTQTTIDQNQTSTSKTTTIADSTITNEELLLKTELAVKAERRSTSEVVRLFQEISKRKLYLERGFPNLYEMATKHFGYCAGSAMRRINAMRLASVIPAVESKLESGELSLSVVSEVQSFFYSEAKEARPYSLNAKIELIETCLNKSRREVEQELVRRNPEREKRESIRHTSVDRVRVSFSISEELNQKLNRLKDLLSHTNPSTEDLIDRLAELGLDKFDPERKAARVRSRHQTAEQKSEQKSEKIPPPAEVKSSSPSQKRSRYIPARERHHMKGHDSGCTYRDEKTGSICGHTKFLERDHIEPYSQGGANTAENLTWLCSAHNKWRYAREN